MTGFREVLLAGLGGERLVESNHAMRLRTILAGPILRRADPDQVWVWLATSTGGRLHAEVRRADTRVRLGAATARSVRLGPRLWVHLAGVRPESGRFPTDTLLVYDLALEGDRGRRRLAELDLVGGISSITYGQATLPSFFLRGPQTHALNLLHGSCRLLHGHGQDAFQAADALLGRTADDLAERPAVLLLTGDQIYGDEVAGALIRHLTRLGSALLGEGDQTSVPGIGLLGELPVDGRQEVAERLAGFTSSNAANHLFSLGEYDAAYLVAWNEGNWPAIWPSAEDAIGPDSGLTGGELVRSRRRYATELGELEAARQAVPAVRRVLANTPTYMCFDDHDVTDDWNLTREWRQGVWERPAGRRVVAGALAAFWAFQGWGNQPDGFDEQFVETVAAGPPPAEPSALQRRTSGEPATQEASTAAPPAAFDQVLWSFDRWSFTVPTSPPTIMLDTRTRRDYDSDRFAALLVNRPERDRITQLCHQTDTPHGGPLLLVSPVPLFGLELQERRQKYLAGKVGPYAIDFEAWHSNLQGLVDFMHLLIGELGLRRLVVLSGDVHYGLNVHATFSIDDAELDIAQLVSSSFRHGGALAKSAMQLLGRLVRSYHVRVGWDHPPSVTGPSGFAQGLFRRPVHTDEWRQDAPVFLPPTVARQVPAEEAPRYRETRQYLASVRRPGWPVVADNNIGSVSVQGPRVIHRLLVPRGGGRTATHTATFDLAGADQSAQPAGS